MSIEAILKNSPVIDYHYILQWLILRGTFTGRLCPDIWSHFTLDASVRAIPIFMVDFEAIVFHHGSVPDPITGRPE